MDLRRGINIAVDAVPAAPPTAPSTASVTALPTASVTALPTASVTALSRLVRQDHWRRRTAP